MKFFFGAGLMLIAATAFSENQLIMATDGPDRYPSIFRLSSGSINVVWESQKYPPDYDIIFAKYYIDRWIEPQRTSNWPYADPWVNHHHPALAKNNQDDFFSVFATGRFPPSMDSAIGDNCFWSTTLDTGYDWTSRWIADTDWWKECSHPAAAQYSLELWLAFQDNRKPADPNIRAMKIVGSQVFPPVDVAATANPERNPALTGSASGFFMAWEAKSGGSWNIYGKKPDGMLQVAIAADATRDECRPSLAASGNYRYCAYTRGNDIAVAYSADGGANFHAVVAAPSSQKQDWPAVACSGRNVDLAYFHASGHILHRHSSDNGVSWSEPDTVTTMSTAIDSPRVAILYDTPCHIVWVDGRNGGADLYYDRGATIGIDERPCARPPVIEISPNPFTRTAMISGPNGTVEIFNVQGGQVASLRGPGTFSFDGSRLPAGVYFVIYGHAGGTTTRKAILLK